MRHLCYWQRVRQRLSNLRRAQCRPRPRVHHHRARLVLRRLLRHRLVLVLARQQVLSLQCHQALRGQAQHPQVLRVRLALREVSLLHRQVKAEAPQVLHLNFRNQDAKAAQQVMQQAVLVQVLEVRRASPGACLGLMGVRPQVMAVHRPKQAVVRLGITV